MNGSAEPPLRLLFDACCLHLLFAPMSMSIKEPSPLKGGQFSATDRGSQIFNECPRHSRLFNYFPPSQCYDKMITSLVMECLEFNLPKAFATSFVKRRDSKKAPSLQILVAFREGRSGLMYFL